MKNAATSFARLASSIAFSLLFASSALAIEAPNKNSAPWLGDTLTGAPCQGKGQGYGPYDYIQRNAFRDNFNLVQIAHFTPEVQNLISGKSGHLTDDLDYTLRAWPNHHPALQSISQYQQLHQTSLDKRYKRKTTSPVECYFQRAIYFSPKDAIAHMLYAIFLQKSDKPKMSAEQYEKALEISPDISSIHYNYGLLLVDMKQYDKAQYHAKQAYAAGYPLPGLKKRLSKAGYWNEQPESRTTTHDK